MRIHSPQCPAPQGWLPQLQRHLLFDRLLASCRELASCPAFVTLRPFAPPAFRQASSLLRTLLTSRPLSCARSPRVRTCTFDSRRQALPHASFGDGWISRSLVRSSPACGLAACSCSYGRVFDTPFFQLRLAASTLGFSTVGVTPSGYLLSDNKYLPMPGTLGRVPPAGRAISIRRAGPARAGSLWWICNPCVTPTLPVCLAA
jgi:hypothetical protein